uniref:Uncharacterized protein LOC123615793 n=1 Tax=Camelus bactrianus TaxID=9837 RepID=A0A9W3G171_CAMBA|nr:uncharacterized protein LOC123615793 [Camelus bactrianus]
MASRGDGSLSPKRALAGYHGSWEVDAPWDSTQHFSLQYSRYGSHWTLGWTSAELSSLVKMLRKLTERGNPGTKAHEPVSSLEKLFRKNCSPLGRRSTSRYPLTRHHCENPRNPAVRQKHPLQSTEIQKDPTFSWEGRRSGYTLTALPLPWDCTATHQGASLGLWVLHWGKQTAQRGHPASLSLLGASQETQGNLHGLTTENQIETEDGRTYSSQRCPC